MTRHPKPIPVLGAQRNPANEDGEAEIAQRVLVALAAKTTGDLPPARDIETGQARMASAAFDGIGYSVTRHGSDLRFDDAGRSGYFIVLHLLLLRSGEVAVRLRDVCAPAGAADLVCLLVEHTLRDLGYHVGASRHTNPAPDDFAARVTAGHIQKATVSARKAHAWATQFSPKDPEVLTLAMTAGEFAAYSGRPLEQWRAELARELAIPVIATAFDSKFHGTIANLETPDEELDDEPAENPARWPSSEVQSLLFDIDHWSVKAAKMWAREHGFKYGYVDTTAEYHHLRQFEPIRGRPCRTVTFEEDARGTILARICSG